MTVESFAGGVTGRDHDTFELFVNDLSEISNSVAPRLQAPFNLGVNAAEDLTQNRTAGTAWPSIKSRPTLSNSSDFTGRVTNRSTDPRPRSD